MGGTKSIFSLLLFSFFLYHNAVNQLNILLPSDCGSLAAETSNKYQHDLKNLRPNFAMF